MLRGQMRDKTQRPSEASLPRQASPDPTIASVKTLARATTRGWHAGGRS
jgi:hypothetical protein